MRFHFHIGTRDIVSYDSRIISCSLSAKFCWSSASQGLAKCSQTIKQLARTLMNVLNLKIIKRNRCSVVEMLMPYCNILQSGNSLFMKRMGCDFSFIIKKILFVSYQKKYFSGVAEKTFLEEMIEMIQRQRERER